MLNIVDEWEEKCVNIIRYLATHTYMYLPMNSTKCKTLGALINEPATHWNPTSRLGV